MRTYQTRAFIWEMITILSVMLGVLGSMCAWEAGGISFFRMLVQAGFFGVFAYAAGSTAATMRRAMRAARRRSRRAAAHPAAAPAQVPAVLRPGRVVSAARAA